MISRQSSLFRPPFQFGTAAPPFPIVGTPVHLLLPSHATLFHLNRRSDNALSARLYARPNGSSRTAHTRAQQTQRCRGQPKRQPSPLRIVFSFFLFSRPLPVTARRRPGLVATFPHKTTSAVSSKPQRLWVSSASSMFSALLLKQFVLFFRFLASGSSHFVCPRCFFIACQVFFF